MPFIGKQPQTGAYSKLDAITTSATATYNLTLDGSAYYPQSANHLMVSLNGVMQAPQDSFTISGSQITFASALTSSDNIDFIMALGDTLDIGVPSDGSVVTGKLANSAVTSAKIGSGAVEGAMVTPFGRRNLIINGDLEVNQRGFTSTTIPVGATYNVDRWKVDFSLNGNTTKEIVNDAPSGFTKSMKFTVNTASTDSMSPGTEYCAFAQFIEDRNLQHLGYGTSDAKKITLSFWVKANHTATYSAGFRSTLGGTTKGNHQSYTINTTNTWEKKVLTFNPDTSGAFTNNGDAGLQLFLSVTNSASVADPTDDGNWDTGNYIGLSSGVTMDNFNDTVGNTIQWTGFQLEVGEVATAFEKRSFGEELALCQRYYERFGQGWWARFESGSQLVVNGQFKVEKRTAPTIGLPVGGTIRLYEWGVADRDASPSLTSTAMAANGGHFKLNGFSTGGSTGEIWGIGGTPSDFSTHPFEAIAEL